MSGSIESQAPSPSDYRAIWLTSNELATEMNALGAGSTAQTGSARNSSNERFAGEYFKAPARVSGRSLILHIVVALFLGGLKFGGVFTSKNLRDNLLTGDVSGVVLVLLGLAAGCMGVFFRWEDARKPSSRTKILQLVFSFVAALLDVLLLVYNFNASEVPDTLSSLCLTASTCLAGGYSLWLGLQSRETQALSWTEYLCLVWQRVPQGHVAWESLPAGEREWVHEKRTEKYADAYFRLLSSSSSHPPPSPPPPRRSSRLRAARAGHGA